MKVTFVVDAATYEGGTASEVVEQMRRHSHDRAQGIEGFMAAVARRAAQVYGAEVRCVGPLTFLRDLERLGEGHLIKLIL